jgi:hypothetical protein
MRIIPTRVHGVLDYLVAVMLIAAPWVLGFSDHTLAASTLVVLGVLTIFYSLLTNYEFGLWLFIPMKIHLWLDFATGIFLVSSPWIFGFSQKAFLPHLIFGLLELVVVVLSNPRPYTRLSEKMHKDFL